MAKRVRRRVLMREDFGLCVCWPKAGWQSVPAPGTTFAALVDGSRRRLKVESETCNCRGTVPHEHRFLALPAAAGLSRGDWCFIETG